MSDPIYKFMELRQSLCDAYDYYAAENLCSKDHAIYYTSKFLLQDSTESIYRHMQLGFSSDCLLRYLEFWGVLQAIIIQQDSLKELYSMILGKKLNSGIAWDEIRDIRNRYSGHPVNKNEKDGAKSRSFLGRGSIRYGRVAVETYKQERDVDKKNRVEHSFFNLKEKIFSYFDEANIFMDEILEEISVKIQ